MLYGLYPVTDGMSMLSKLGFRNLGKCLIINLPTHMVFQKEFSEASSNFGTLWKSSNFRFIASPKSISYFAQMS